jgi:hypothetical protein
VEESGVGGCERVHARRAEVRRNGDKKKRQYLSRGLDQVCRFCPSLCVVILGGVREGKVGRSVSAIRRNTHLATLYTCELWNGSPSSERPFSAAPRADCAAPYPMCQCCRA